MAVCRTRAGSNTGGAQTWEMPRLMGLHLLWGILQVGLLGFKSPEIGQFENSRLDEVTVRRNLDRRVRHRKRKMEGG